MLSPVRNFRDCTFAIIRRVKFAFLFLFNLHGKTLLRFSRYKRQIHEESSRIGENPSRLERDFFFFFLFLSTFRFIIQQNLYYIFPNYERNFFLLIVFFFYFPIYIYFYLFTMNFCVFEMWYSNIYEEEKFPVSYIYVILFYEISL